MKKAIEIKLLDTNSIPINVTFNVSTQVVGLVLAAYFLIFVRILKKGL